MASIAYSMPAAPAASSSIRGWARTTSRCTPTRFQYAPPTTTARPASRPSNASTSRCRPKTPCRTSTSRRSRRPCSTCSASTGERRRRSRESRSIDESEEFRGRGRNAGSRISRIAAAGCVLFALTVPSYAAEPPAAAARAASTPAPSASTPPQSAADTDRAQQLDAYMLAASAFLGVDQLDALSKITDKDRRYLAMTYYLRARSPIAERWSWTNEEIKAYERSTEYTQALAEIEKITTRFSTDNPGYL